MKSFQSPHENGHALKHRRRNSPPPAAGRDILDLKDLSRVEVHINEEKGLPGVINAEIIAG